MYYNIVMKNKREKPIVDIEYFSDTHSPGKGCAVTVGNFDGVHLGHRLLLETLKRQAQHGGLTALVFSFSSDYRKKDGAGLATPQKKRELLAEYADGLCVADFSRVCDMTPREFVCSVLKDTLDAKYVVCGYDFRFGKDRSGDASVLKELCFRQGIGFVQAEPFLDNGAPVSSTVIRKLVSQGDLKNANRLLGREYCFSAPVISGNRIGRTLGLPTLNQQFPRELTLPPLGVYAVKCKVGQTTFSGVANLGVRPTVCSCDEVLCETHLFDFCGDLYGMTAEIAFVDFLRFETKFDSLDSLSRQARLDAEKAKEILFGV